MRILFSATLMIAAGLFLYSACQWFDSPPKLSDKERVDLWIDLHTAQMAAQNFPSDERDSIEQVLIEDIAPHYGMTPGEVNRFMEGMKDRPEEMLKLYEVAMDSVQNLKHEMRTIPED